MWNRLTGWLARLDAIRSTSTAAPPDDASQSSHAFRSPKCDVSVLTFLESIFDLNVGIDELLGPSYIAVKLSSPGRMSPSAAVCFALGSMGLMMTAARSVRKRSAIALGLSGSNMAAVGMATSMGFALGSSEAFG